MLVKIVLLFLAAMALVAMIGNLMFPGAARRMVRRQLPGAKMCPRCGKPQIGRAPCSCRKV